jgi:hypothetical protein
MASLSHQLRDLDAQIVELRRELKMRHWVYKKKVEAGTMPPQTARRQYDLMKGAIASLEAYRAVLSTPSLFTPAATSTPSEHA